MSRSTKTEKPFSSVVPIRPDGSAPPLFFIHGVGGIVPEVELLIPKLDPRHPVYGIQSQAFDTSSPALLTLEEMAAYHLKEIRRFVPHGPYYLVGFSFGGMLAFEMAQQLRRQGEERPVIAMIDSCEMSFLKRLGKVDPAGQRASDLAGRLRRRFKEAVEKPNTIAYMKEKIESRFFRTLYSVSSRFGITLSSSIHYPYHVNWFAAVNYEPKTYDEKFFLFKATDHFWEPRIPADLGWGPWATGGVEIVDIPGDHVSLMIEPSVSALASNLARCLETVALSGRPQ